MDLNRVSKIDNMVKINTVLMSVADKTGILDFARELIGINPDLTIYSTGGTYGTLESGLGGLAPKHLKQVSGYTGQPEMQGGLVKTLDFKIYLGLLSETYNDDHQKDLERLDASVIDMVVVNLYPFKNTVSSKGATLEDARTNIDIGGPCMLRASAKNFLRVASVCDPSEYGSIIAAVQKNGGCLSANDRLDLAKKSFAHTAGYDAAISAFLSDKAESALTVYSWDE